MATPAIVAPLIAAAVSGGASIAASQLSKPDSPSAPELSDERKNAMGSFAERMAQEEEEMKKQNGQGNYLLGPGGQPIRFRQPTRLPTNGPITY